MNKKIVVPTYKQMKRNKFYAHLIIIFGFIVLACNAFIYHNFLLIIIWMLVIFLNVLKLRVIDEKIELRDLVKKKYENDNNIILTREEFDDIIMKDPDVLK